jgi:hypothetical protein
VKRRLGANSPPTLESMSVKQTYCPKMDHQFEESHMKKFNFKKKNTARMQPKNDQRPNSQPKSGRRAATRPKRKTKKVRARDAKLHVAVQKMGAEWEHGFNPETVKEASSYLRSHFEISPEFISDPSNNWESLTGLKITTKHVRASHENYLKALQFIYLVYVLTMDAVIKENIIRAICEHLHLTPSKKTDVLTLIARTFIDYGSARDTQNRKAWNRDVNAIRFLMSEKVPPQGVLKYHDTQGGGIDAWSRSWARSNKVHAGTESSVAGADVRQKTGVPLNKIESQLSKSWKEREAFVVVIQKLKGKFVVREQRSIGGLNPHDSERLKEVIEALRKFCPKSGRPGTNVSLDGVGLKTPGAIRALPS